MTARIPNATAAMDAAIDATHRQQGDPMPTAEELIRHLRDLGYTVLPRPDAARARPFGCQAHMDEALAGAKAAFDHADAQHHPDALALIRAAETMYEHLFGDRADEHTADLLIAYTHWLSRKNQLVDVDQDVIEELDDLALHFLAEQRETDAGKDRMAGMRAYTANWGGADADDELSEPATAPAGDRSPAPAHLEPGFGGNDYAEMPALTGTGADDEIEAYESSSAEGPHLWLKATDGSTGRTARVHVSADTAWKFAEQLITLVRNHAYGDSTPAGAVYRVTPLFGGPTTTVSEVA